MCKQYILPCLSRLHFVRFIRHFRCVLRFELALSKEADGTNSVSFILGASGLIVIDCFVFLGLGRLLGIVLNWDGNNRICAIFTLLLWFIVCRMSTANEKSVFISSPILQTWATQSIVLFLFICLLLGNCQFP